MPTLPESPPLLSEEGLRLDWPDVHYNTSAKIWSGGASITNTLTGSEILPQLIRGNHARWTVEFRCPKTLYSRVYENTAETFDLSWNPMHVAGRVFLIPGLVATKDLQLSTTELLPGMWDTQTVTIPQGWWLARGRTYANESLVQSLLAFKTDEFLEDGGMRVDPETASGDLRFVCCLAPALYARIGISRDVQIAGLIGVCARLPEFDLDEEPYAIVSAVKELLVDRGVPTWLDTGYDPARAATAIERFITPNIDANDDD